MKPTVHILATVRKPELLDAALLVFRTFRTGFPTGQLHVWGNGLEDWSALLLANAAQKVGGVFTNLAPTSHDAWIESLIEESLAPFWICDTDIIFWQAVEAWFDPSFVQTSALYAGRYEPTFHEEWTNTRHVERLHTALMWLDPARVREAMRRFTATVPAPWRNTADFPFVRQHFIPARGELTLFYDTLAGLYHAAPGTAFTDAQNAAFEHLHCATYADQLDNPAFAAVHRRVYQDATAARGLRERQEKYYASRKIKPKKGKTHAV